MALTIVRNNIVDMETDAIVNTASPHPQYGTGLDTAVYKAAGEEQLLDARAEIGEIPRGEVAVTPGFDLPAKYIIHAVGCWWDGGDKGEEEILRSCYRKSLETAKELGCEDLAIPLISTGNYGFPKKLAMQIATEEINSFLLDNDMDIYLVVFGKEAFDISEQLMHDVQQYIDEHQVQELSEMEYAANVPDRRRLERAPYTGSVTNIDIPDEEELILKRAPKMMAPMEVYEDEAESGESVDAMRISEMPDFGEVGKSFRDKLFDLIDERGLTDPEVYKKANISRKLFSKIRSLDPYTPKKETILALAIALELDLDETQDLLSRAGYTLSPSYVFDLIVRYFIEKGEYDIFTINEILYGYDQKLLGQ